MDIRVADAVMHDSGPGYAIKGAVDRAQAERTCYLRARLHIGFVDLHDIRPGIEEIADLLVHGGRIVHGGVLAASAVVVDLRLLGHRERPRNRRLDAALGVAAQKLEVAHTDRMAAADRRDNTRHGIRVTTAIERSARILEVDSIEGGREAVGVALAPYLPVRDDVETGILLCLDGH